MEITRRHVVITIGVSSPKGWQLEQPEPGVLVWRTPAGRTYTTIPAEYPV